MTCCSFSCGQVTEYLNSERRGIESRRSVRMKSDMVALGRASGGAGSSTVQRDHVVKVEGTHPLRQGWG